MEEGEVVNCHPHLQRHNESQIQKHNAKHFTTRKQALDNYMYDRSSDV